MSAVISGTATILTAPAGCHVLLIRESDAEVVAQTQANPDTGAYTFSLQPEGKYAIVFIDPDGTHRAKCAHVEVLP